MAKRAAIASGSAGSGGTGSGNHAQPLEVVRAVSLELEKRGLLKCIGFLIDHYAQLEMHWIPHRPLCATVKMKLVGLPVLRHSDKVEAVNLCIKGKNSSKVIGGSSLSVSRVASSVRIDTTRTYYHYMWTL